MAEILSGAAIGALSGIAAVFLHIVLHEAGHLIAGKMSGYGFVSFRVFTVTFVKARGKIRIKKYGIPGTAGQCLMSPPEPKDGKFPYFFYNLGGSLINFITAAAAFTAALFMDSPLVSVPFLVFAVIGFLLGLSSVIPMKAGGMANDGYNMMTLGKREEARRAFWLMLRVNALLAGGQRVGDMPAEWFEMPDQADLSDVMIASTANLCLYRLIDRHEFEQAKAFAETVLNEAGIMPEIYKNEIGCELLFLEIIGGCREDEIGRMYTGELKAYISKMALHISKHRLAYAYARLVSRDEAEAEKARLQFEKVCAACPNAGEADGERELMGIIDSLPA